MDNFNGPADQAERERLGRRIEGGPGPLEQQRLSKEAEERLSQLIKLDEKLKKVDTGILEVEQHIIDRLRSESGASNISLLAEALQTVRAMERREEDK